MRILLTGYAGLLGRHIARELKKDGHLVRVVLHARTVSVRAFASEADEVVWGSLDNYSDRCRALEGVDAVVHSAWQFSSEGDDRPTVNERITEALFHESVKEGVKHFAFISSVSRYGMSLEKGLKVSEEYRSAGEDHTFIYPSEKARLEEILLRLSGTEISLGIFRPGPIFDDTKAPFKKLLKFGKRYVAVGFGTGRNIMPYIHAQDVAVAVCLWLQRSGDVGVFNITPDECLRHKDWYRRWGKRNGLTVRPLFVRGFVLRIAAVLATVLKKLLGKTGKVNVDYILASATRNMDYDNTRARSVLGWTPRVTNLYEAE